MMVKWLMSCCFVKLWIGGSCMLVCRIWLLMWVCMLWMIWSMSGIGDLLLRLSCSIVLFCFGGCIGGVIGMVFCVWSEIVYVVVSECIVTGKQIGRAHV